MIVERQLHRIVKLPRSFGPSCQPTFIPALSEEEVVFWAKANVRKTVMRIDEALTLAILDFETGVYQVSYDESYYLLFSKGKWTEKIDHV